MDRKRIFYALSALFVFIVLAMGGLLGYWYFMNRYTVCISHDSGIYTESFLLEIETVGGAEIYYTMDGSEPVPGQEGTLCYETPLEIAMGADTQIYSLQIKCLFSGEQEAVVLRREFIMESEGVSRYQVPYIVSVTGNEDSLWGYEKGIFVRGRKYDAFMEENPDVDILTEVIPANYDEDIEVPVHVSVFNGTGEEILSKNCGLKIYGNWTRAKNQKSFRLYARDIYDGENVFSYPFLPTLLSEKTNAVIDEWQRISFHNAGNDNGYAFLRNSLVGELADQFGFLDVLLSQSAVVYVNGRYQGLYWLQNTYDDKFFKEKYGNYSGEMVVCQGKLDLMWEEENDTQQELYCTEEYNAFCEWIREADLEEEADWEQVCEVIDIENFAEYMAIQYYIGNIDWPHNNVKVYRYLSGDESGGYRENSVFDGRYRYLLFDTDCSMGYKFQGFYGYDAEERRLSTLCTSGGHSDLFAKLIRREEFRNHFINAVLVLSQGAFSEENVKTVLKSMTKDRNQELQYMYEETDLMKNSLWESDDNNFENILTEYAEILEYAQKRPEVVLEEVRTVLDCGEAIPLTVIAPLEGTLEIDGMKAQYEGYCYEKIPVSLCFRLKTGKKVIGYYINGQYVSGAELELYPAAWGDETGGIYIAPVIEDFYVEELSIMSYNINGSNDYVLLGNTGNMTINLSQYHISDCMELTKGNLPDIQLKPGQVFYVYGNKYRGSMAANSIQVSFSWNDEESIILSNNGKGIISQRK